MPRTADAQQGLPGVDSHGNLIIYLSVGQRPTSIATVPAGAIVAHGQPGHRCYRVYPWQAEYWSAHAHTGAHDCPDGGCR